MISWIMCSRCLASSLSLPPRTHRVAAYAVTPRTTTVPMPVTIALNPRRPPSPSAASPEVIPAALRPITLPLKKRAVIGTLAAVATATISLTCASSSPALTFPSIRALSYLTVFSARSMTFGARSPKCALAAAPMAAFSWRDTTLSACESWTMSLMMETEISSWLSGTAEITSSTRRATFSGEASVVASVCLTSSLESEDRLDRDMNT